MERLLSFFPLGPYTNPWGHHLFGVPPSGGPNRLKPATAGFSPLRCLDGKNAPTSDVGICLPSGRALGFVAQIFNLPYRRLAVGRAPDGSHASAVPNGWQSATLRYVTAQRSRNQIVLALDCPISDYENEDDDEDERFAGPATIWTDSDRVQLCAASGAKHFEAERQALALIDHPNIARVFDGGAT